MFGNPLYYRNHFWPDFLIDKPELFVFWLELFPSDKLDFLFKLMVILLISAALPAFSWWIADLVSSYHPVAKITIGFLTEFLITSNSIHKQTKVDCDDQKKMKFSNLFTKWPTIQGVSACSLQKNLNMSENVNIVCLQWRWSFTVLDNNIQWLTCNGKHKHQQHL